VGCNFWAFPLKRTWPITTCLALPCRHVIRRPFRFRSVSLCKALPRPILPESSRSVRQTVKPVLLCSFSDDLFGDVDAIIGLDFDQEQDLFVVNLPTMPLLPLSVAGDATTVVDACLPVTNLDPATFQRSVFSKSELSAVQLSQRPTWPDMTTSNDRPTVNRHRRILPPGDYLVPSIPVEPRTVIPRHHHERKIMKMTSSPCRIPRHDIY
jgi:hypothetical protein